MIGILHDRLGVPEDEESPDRFSFPAFLAQFHRQFHHLGEDFRLHHLDERRALREREDLELLPHLHDHHGVQGAQVLDSRQKEDKIPGLQIALGEGQECSQLDLLDPFQIHRRQVKNLFGYALELGS